MCRFANQLCQLYSFLIITIRKERKLKNVHAKMTVCEIYCQQDYSRMYYIHASCELKFNYESELGIKR